MLFSKVLNFCTSSITKKMGTSKRGALIVIEGVDRSGKSTQCKKLVEALKTKNIAAQLMNFPDRTTLTGKLIDEYLRNEQFKVNDHAIHLLFSANRWENVEKINSLLYDGVTLVIDRYSYSGVVFSAAKTNMDMKWCQHPENGLPKPDLVFLLTLSQEEMLSRPGFGMERYENSSFQNNVAKMYSQVCDEKDNWIKVNAAGTIDEVHEKLLAATVEKIDEVGSTPLGTLNFDNSIGNS
ncbi:thymidylate kinase [Leptinotarsa decemlineata]|uniref:thymidylate kinase n=1 Tax=Leptinotarsa decemlineata TaxID=7539 RepID=UPI003D309272